MKKSFQKVVIICLGIFLGIAGQLIVLNQHNNVKANESTTSYYIIRSNVQGQPLIVPPSSWVAGKTAKDLASFIPHCSLVTKWDKEKRAWISYIPQIESTNFPLEAGRGYAIGVTEDTLVYFPGVEDPTEIDMPRTSQLIDQYHFTLPANWVGKKASDLINHLNNTNNFKNNNNLFYYDINKHGWMEYIKAVPPTDFVLEQGISYGVQVMDNTLFDPILQGIGNLIKLPSDNNVYYLGDDYKRHWIPNISGYEAYRNAVMNSWGWADSNVITVSQSELESYPLGENVFIKANTYHLKIETGVEIYNVEHDNFLKQIDSTANHPYGWDDFVIIPDTIFTTYQIIESYICTDSDGGKNYYQKGICQSWVDNYQKHEEFCLNNNNLMENFPTQDNNGKLICGSEVYTCPNGCQSGACVKDVLAKPDLIIENLQFYPQDPKQSQSFTGSVNMAVKNQGNAATSYHEGIRASIYMKKPDGTLINMGGLPTDYLQYKNNLSAGESLTVSFPIKNMVVDATYITVVGDVDNAQAGFGGFIAESNEENNILTKNMIISEYKIPFRIYNIQVTDISTTSATIVWSTSATAIGELRYDTDSNNLLNRWLIPSASVNTEHSAPLSHLTPNTTYYYKIYMKDDLGNSITTQRYSFQTLSLAQPETLAVKPQGDTKSITPTEAKDLNQQVKYERSVVKQVKGRMLLRVEKGGEIWYVNPKDEKKYSVTFANALPLFENLALGITDADLAKIPIAGTNEVGNLALRNRLKGWLLLQVEQRGAIWYVDKDGYRHSVTWGNLMDLFRKLALGITNNDLNKIYYGGMENKAN